MRMTLMTYILKVHGRHYKKISKWKCRQRIRCQADKINLHIHNSFSDTINRLKLTMYLYSYVSCCAVHNKYITIPFTPHLHNTRNNISYQKVLNLRIVFYVWRHISPDLRKMIALFNDLCKAWLKCIFYVLRMRNAQ